MKHFDDHEVLKRFIKGDRDSFSLIYNAYVRELFSYGMGLGYDTETIKDVVQDLFLKLLCKPELLKNVQNLKYFLLRSLKNSLLNISRSHINKDSIDGYIHVFSNKVTILDQMIEVEDKVLIEQKIENLLDQLSNRQKEAIYLRYIQSLGYEEIAELMNMGVPSVRNLVARGINKIRENQVKIVLLPQTILFIFG